MIKPARWPANDCVCSLKQSARSCVGRCARWPRLIANWPATVLETKSQVRGLEQVAVEFQVEPQPVDGAQRLLPNALERELAESLRRAYSLIRRFVRVGTGLLRSKTKQGRE